MIASSARVAIQHRMDKSEKTWSLKEIDEQRGALKGTAFLAFKALKAGFDEGREFYYLNHEDDTAELESLRAQGRIYRSTVNTILLTEVGYAAVSDYLND